MYISIPGISQIIILIVVVVLVFFIMLHALDLLHFFFIRKFTPALPLYILARYFKKKHEQILSLDITLQDEDGFCVCIVHTDKEVYSFGVQGTKIIMAHRIDTNSSLENQHYHLRRELDNQKTKEKNTVLVENK